MRQTGSGLDEAAGAARHARARQSRYNARHMHRPHTGSMIALQRHPIWLRALRARATLAATILLVGVSAAAAEQAYSFDRTPGRLPKAVVPTHYAIELEPNLENLILAGSELIDIEVREPTDKLVLNAVGMTIGDASIDDAAASARIALDGEAETATLTFPRVLPAGPHKLRINFRAQINKFGRGMFLVEYPTDSGMRRMVSTHLEPADARRVFPCWDEPAFKASIALTVTLPRSFLAVGNMPVAREEPVTPTLKQVAFAVTPRMSTYLFVLTAGELERVSAQADGVDHRRRNYGGKARPGGLCARERRQPVALFQRLFRGEIPAAQARSDRGARRVSRRHGKLGRDYVLREQTVVRSEHQRAGLAARHFQSAGA